MRYLTAEEVADINASLLDQSVILDAGLIASAVGRPAQTVFGGDAYDTIWLKVAALFESLALNHAFLDGNKRTAVIAAIHMLNWNGFEVVAEQYEVVDLALDCVGKSIDLHKIAEFFEEHAVPIRYKD